MDGGGGKKAQCYNKIKKPSAYRVKGVRVASNGRFLVIFQIFLKESNSEGSVVFSYVKGSILLNL